MRQGIAGRRPVRNESAFNLSLALLRSLGSAPVVLLGLASLIVTGDFWRSWGELRVFLDNDKLGGPFLPVFVAVLFAYAPWSRLLLLRILGALVNLAGAALVLLMSAIFAFVSVIGGPDARAGSSPPTIVTVLLLLLALGCLASMGATIVDTVLSARRPRTFPPRPTTGEVVAFVLLLGVVAASYARNRAVEKHQGEEMRRSEERIKRERAMAEGAR